MRLPVPAATITPVTASAEAGHLIDQAVECLVDRGADNFTRWERAKQPKELQTQLGAAGTLPDTTGVADADSKAASTNDVSKHRRSRHMRAGRRLIRRNNGRELPR